MSRPATRPLDRDVQVALIRAAELLSQGCDWRMIDVSEAKAVLKVIDTILTTRAPEVRERQKQFGDLSPVTRRVEAVAVCDQCLWKPKPQCAACKGCKKWPNYIVGRWRRGRGEEADE